MFRVNVRNCATCAYFFQRLIRSASSISPSDTTGAGKHAAMSSSDISVLRARSSRTSCGNGESGADPYARARRFRPRVSGSRVRTRDVFVRIFAARARNSAAARSSIVAVCSSTRALSSSRMFATDAAMALSISLAAADTRGFVGDIAVDDDTNTGDAGGDVAHTDSCGRDSAGDGTYACVDACVGT